MRAGVRQFVGLALIVPWLCLAGPAVRREGAREVQIRPDGEVIVSGRASEHLADEQADAAISAEAAVAAHGVAREAQQAAPSPEAAPLWSKTSAPTTAGFQVAEHLPGWAALHHALQAASSKAFRGGAASFAAGALQVATFMWLRTIMNRQYYNGGTMLSQARELYAEGGLARFYQGFGWAVLMVPLSRFGDAFANVGVLALFADAAIHPLVTTILVAFVASLWRVMIFPIDTAKTMAQVHGSGAGPLLSEKMRRGGLLVLWAGVSVHFLTSWACSYPWWATFNMLDRLWPAAGDPIGQTVRLGCMGPCAAVVSDVVFNSLRVLKTLRQAHPDATHDYATTLKIARSQETGFLGLAGRGLAARTIADVFQGALFSIAWKLVEQKA